MNKKIIVEGLDYLDMVDQIEPNVSVDEYAAKMGRDSEIVTLAFIVKNEAAGNDLVDWFERGYDWILDASLSDGQLAPGQYLVFVEMKRRSKVPERIVELLEDLKTLTNMDLDEWTVQVNEEEYEPDTEQLKQVITISPHEYRVEEEGEEELNEMRQKAGLEPVRVLPEQDAELKAFKSMAGL
jgi:hypothetical protein